MITGLLNSGVGLAVQRLASEKHTITINTGASATEFTESQCSKYGIHYTYDVHALSVGTATQVMKQGGDSWFFITVNYAFGRSLQNSATEVVERLGGKVLGSVITPLATTDFSSYLTQAQASGAKIIALANTGLDTVNAIKTARAFHIGGKDQKIVALETFIGDIKSIGLENAQGLEFTTAFYWDRNPETRAWSERFFKKTGFMPNQVQAGTYSGVMTYLKAVAAAGTDNADAVRSELGKMKINDFFVHDGTIEPNGLMLHDMYLVKVKQPSESHGPWDILNVVSTINAKDAFIPLSKSQCPLLHSGQN
jgi:branched-chain amino acid transport system substrate-binding protein